MWNREIYFYYHMKQKGLYKGSDHIRAEWIDPNDIRRSLKEDLFIGETLNFPCGYSDLGDYRVDIDPDVDPDQTGDLLDYPHDLPRFDTVYSDPPYRFYHQESHEWIYALWELARERLVLQSPLCAVHIPADKEWHIYESRPGSAGNRVIAFQVFDRPDRRLDEFTD